jgi:copper transport protein
MFYFCVLRNRRPASAVVAFAVFAAAGVCGVVAVRVVRAVSETMTQQAPARIAPTTPDRGAATRFTTTIAGPTYLLQVDVDPARTGTNSIHLYALTPDKSPLPVVEWKGTAELSEKGIEPVAIPLLPLTADHATGVINLSALGDWQLRFTVRLSTTDEATVSVTVPVRT